MRHDAAQDRDSKFLAVDAALLPPDEITDTVIGINKELSRRFKNKNRIKLDSKTCLPHITLAMGCISESDISTIDEKLSGIAKKNPQMHFESISALESKAWIRIRNVHSLQRLHETIMKELASFFRYDVTEDMIYKKKHEEIDTVTIDYINHFPVESSFDRYEPHITVGSGDMELKSPQISFRVLKLALCHLGNFCTCRRVLLSYNLAKI